MLKIKRLKASVEGKEIIKSVDLSVGDGEIVALMGPNGSGKSSLSNVIMGNPEYKVESGEVTYKGKDLLEMSVDERAKMGILMSFQSPVAIPGVSVRELLLSAMRQRGLTVSALSMKNKIAETAEKLNLAPELLSRGVHEGFSGGEKKKIEVLQMKILSPSLLILDEIDSGLDIDALKVLAKAVREEVKQRKMSVLVITHYQRLLKYLIPDRVVVIKQGVVVDRGGKEVVRKLEKKGYRVYE